VTKAATTTFIKKGAAKTASASASDKSKEETPN